MTQNGGNYREGKLLKAQFQIGTQRQKQSSEQPDGGGLSPAPPSTWTPRWLSARFLQPLLKGHLLSQAFPDHHLNTPSPALSPCPLALICVLLLYYTPFGSCVSSLESSTSP